MFGKAAKAAARRPLLTTKMAIPAGKAGVKASKPVVKRQARAFVGQLDEASRAFGETLASYAPGLAYDLGLAKPPKQKRSAPRVIAGALVGAGAVYCACPCCWGVDVGDVGVVFFFDRFCVQRRIATQAQRRLVVGKRCDLRSRARRPQHGMTRRPADDRPRKICVLGDR